jgi:hypothetical protein
LLKLLKYVNIYFESVPNVKCGFGDVLSVFTSYCYRLTTCGVPRLIAVYGDPFFVIVPDMLGVGVIS